MRKKRPDIRHTVQFTSFGGLGTTFLYEWADRAGLRIYQPKDGGPCSHDYGVWKHLRNPVSIQDHLHPDVRGRFRVVYLIGNPYNALISLFRRHLQHFSLDRLQVPMKMRERFTEDWTLEDYLVNQVDIFGFEAHFTNWIRQPLEKDYPILVMKYETLHDNLDTLFDFLRVGDAQRALFPPRKPRQSDWQSLDEQQQRQIQRIYGSLKTKVDRLPDTLLR